MKPKLIALLLTVSTAALTTAPAIAADLGGNCCADLEERIAELEATTVRKGNRKVSVEISGWVNTGVLYFDDGNEQNAYVVDNAQDRTRLRVRGSAKISPDVQAGYLLEVGVRTARADRVSAAVDDTNDGLDVRHSSWFINSNTLGRVTLGQTSQVSDGITQINVAGINHVSRSQVGDWNANFNINQNGASTGVRWRDLAVRENPGEGNRQNLVRYDSPVFAGFTASANWGEDDVWDVGLRYAGDIGGFKLAGGVSYTQWTENDASGTTCRNSSGGAATTTQCDMLGLSVSALHKDTGLFGTFAYGYLQDDQRANAVAATVARNRVEDRDEFYWVQGGIQQKWSPLGKTSIYGEYYSGDFGTSAATVSAASGFALADRQVISSSVDMWGVGFNQSIDAAAMDVYIGYRSYEADITAEGGKLGGLNDFQAVLAGGIVRF